LYASLIGFHPRRLKGLQGMSCLATDLGLFSSSDCTVPAHFEH